MCGRYVLFSDTEIAEIREIIEEVQRKINGEIKTGEIFPTDKAPVLIQEQGIITPEAVKWGFPKKTKGVIINIRTDTTMEDPKWKYRLETSRCIIPSCGFYEWTKKEKKIKYQFNLSDSRALYMAGLWKDFNGERRFTILTTEANDSIKEIHSRMPVVLTHSEMERWMWSYKDALDILKTERPELVKAPA
ncbi:SOS response-associated peptidase family protein [Clostridium sp. KNHs216]|uniref:SOS response-associated peptidase n=1 Tax=Clostridium sp. KNHs216 TaxID=1550235 RepID=UPI001151B178|nr:SOS response-associated peptidase family protein [Clostridium sp. KNHs216]TQI68552.1 putative SOS response-associated peptidase YedK [Clostridium sp. KNHs216]